MATYHGNATKRPLARRIAEQTSQALGAAFHGEVGDQGGGILVVFQDIGGVRNGVRNVGGQLGGHGRGGGDDEVVGAGGIGDDVLAEAVDGLGERDDGAKPREHPRTSSQQVFERGSVTCPCGGQVGPDARVVEGDGGRDWCYGGAGRCHSPSARAGDDLAFHSSGDRRNKAPRVLGARSSGPAKGGW